MTRTASNLLPLSSAIQNRPAQAIRVSMALVAFVACWSFPAVIQAQSPTWRVTDLGTLGGNYSRAAAISETGQVAGVSMTAGGEYHAFSWTSFGGMVDLGTFGGSSSWATAVSAATSLVRAGS